TSSGSGPRRQETIGDVAAQTRVLALETTKTNQALEIGSLKRKEDASKQRRIIDNLDADEGVALVDEAQGRNDQDMFDTCVLDDEEVVAEKEVSAADPITTADEVVTTAGVEVSTAATTPTISIDDITLAKAVAALKSAKPMVARNLEAQLQAELKEEERLARQKEEEANIALSAEWDDKDKAEGSETRAEGSSKRAGDELEYDKSKKQKLDEQVEVEEDNDQEEAEMKIYMKIISDDKIAIDTIPLATKPPIIVD
nr:hypothetical protein [Tanacetum cinerariifolium]